MRLTLALLAATAAVAFAACGEKTEPKTAAATPDPVASLLDELRGGGDVLVFRHTTTENTTPPQEKLGDCSTQRNLNDQGRREAREIGVAIRELGVPVGTVLASPLCRGRETAKLMFGRERTARALVSPGMLGSDADDRRRARALRRLAATTPPGNKNTMLVTHTGNIGGAFDESVLEGEALVFRPGPEAGAPELRGRISLEDWRRLTGG
jgi:phosphohistidine phosphatase SixA